ncbi:MAG: PilZ domain-containing protein [Anaerolineae bacterium]
MSEGERREFQRLEASYPFLYEQFNAEGRKVAAGLAQTLNISASGLLLETDHLLEPGTSLILQMSSPLFTLLAKGVVVHTRALNDGRFLTGVMLTEVVEGRWDKLVGEVASASTM